MGNETSNRIFRCTGRGEIHCAGLRRPRPISATCNRRSARPLDETTIYTVVAGDNLSKIAKHFYGNANAWKQIFDANRDQLSRIRTGSSPARC